MPDLLLMIENGVILGRSGTGVLVKGGVLMKGTDVLTTKAVHNSCYGDGVLATNNELKVGYYGEG